MKKKLSIIIIIMCALLLTGCGKKYKGYWCSYDETATIVVLLKDNNTESNRAKIEAAISNFENVENHTYYSKEDYAAELGGDASNIDIYDTYVILFSSMDNIGDYIKELSDMDGVKSAEQSNAKTNMSLYNIKSWGKYTYTDSDEAKESDLENGKYHVKNGVITFVPDDKNGTTKMLYIKDDHLCSDATCSKIYAISDENCGSQK